MWFGLGDTSLEWGLGARLLSLAHFTACILFAALVSTMQKDEVLAIADPKDRELVRFSVGETFDANVKVSLAGRGSPAPKHRPARHVHRAPGLQGTPLREVAPRGSRGWRIAPHMGPPGGGCG